VETQDVKALQIVITSLLVLQVAATDQLHKDLAYLFTSITLLRRNLYLGGLHDRLHKAISTSAMARARLRHASMTGESLFGDGQVDMIADIIGYIGDMIKIKRFSP
jgi:hypothetical protein